MSYNGNAYQVLIVENDPGDLKLLKRYLRKSELPIKKVIHVEGFDSLPSLKNEDPIDIVILDLNLPNFAGVESVIFIDRMMPRTPVVVFSGSETIELAIESISVGAQDYLIKGEFDEKILAKTIQYSIQRKRTMIKLRESEQMFSTVFYKSPLKSCIMDSASGKFIDVNDHFAEFIDLDRDEIKDRTPAEVGLVFDDHSRKQMFAALKEKGFVKNHNATIQNRNGAFKWVSVSIEKIIVNGNNYFIATLIDITKSVEIAEKLRRSNERYELINKATHDTVWEWDFRTKTGQWGDGIIQVFGYDKQSMQYDENWIIDLIHPDDREGLIQKLQNCLVSKTETWEDHFRFKAADGTYRHVYDRGFIIFDAEGNPDRMVGAMTDVTEKKKLEEEIAVQQIRQQQLITEVAIQTQEKERNELGRELHDNINQIIAAAKLYLEMVRHGNDGNFELVKRAIVSLSKAIEEIRNLSHTLVSPSLGDSSLKTILQGLLDNAGLQNNFKTRLFFDEHYFDMHVDKKLELAMYRIIQEQITNIVKHASAKNISISIEVDGDYLLMVIIDDGVGTKAAGKAKGIGLRNISSRAAFYSGTVQTVSAPGQGYSLEVRIPLLGVSFPD